MMLNQLAVTTPTDTQIVMTRSFNAPRQLVWDAMSKPALIKKWLFGPPGWTMTKCDEDQRPGGTFQWAWVGPNGEAMSMHGEYREVVPPQRMTRTESFETGCTPQMGTQVCTLELTESGGKTHLKLTMNFPSKQARDGAIASGMEHGVRAGYDRLEEMLTSNSF